MEKVRLGFVGVGGMGQAAHLRNYVVLPDCQVVAIAEIRPRLARDVATRHAIPKVYPSHRELLASESLDGIVAIQPFGMHVDLVPELLAKGVPVLTEKPLADSPEHGETIAASARRSKAPLFIAYHKRSDLACVFAKAQIDAWKASGEMGKLRYIRMTMPPGDWIAGGFAHNINTDEKYEARWGVDNDYGRFVNYYIHQVNLIRYLLSDDYAVTFADPGGVTLTGRSVSGVTITLEMATHETSIDWQEEAFVSFERGWIKIELPAPLAIDRPGRVTVFRDIKGQTPTTTSPTLLLVHAMRQQAMNFVRAIRGEKTPLCSADDALKDLQVATQYIELLAQSRRQFGTTQEK
jgi:predicted dehydrogenase